MLYTYILIGDKTNASRIVSRLNLIDLAGSERQASTGATGQTLKEGAKINQSLSSLGNVITALSKGALHVPYRNSKLTRLLQSSLGGNCKTLMIANMSMAADSFEETLSTLRYANRAKNIQNHVVVNIDPKLKRIKELEAEIAALRKACTCGAAGEVQRRPTEISISLGTDWKICPTCERGPPKQQCCVIT